MPLPHIGNSKAGVNKYDPVNKNLFEVDFILPTAIRLEYGKDELLLTEHVLKISGLGALDRAPSVAQQKFMGTDRSYIVPKLDSTHAEIQIDFTLNLRDDTDNYIYKVFKAWARLGYNINTGERHLKREYCADWMRVSISNRVGTIIREIVFKDVMINGDISGMDELDYDSGDAVTLSVKFVSDWWTEADA